MANGKIYRRFAEDFVNSHRHIECSRTVCRNCHEMNIHIVKGLLDDCPALVKSFFEASSFSFEASVELKRLYDTTDFTAPSIVSSNTHTNCVLLSFGCSFTRNQLEGIANCANRYALFCSEVTADDIATLSVQLPVRVSSLGKQYSPCCHSVRCVTRPQFHTMELADGSRQKETAAKKGRQQVPQYIQSVHCGFRYERFGRSHCFRHTPGGRWLERMTKNRRPRKKMQTNTQ